MTPYLLNLYFLRQFISVDPGIASFSLPIINEDEVATYKKYLLYNSAFASNASACKMNKSSIVLIVTSVSNKQYSTAKL